MLIGKVTGTVVATQKTDSLDSFKLLLLEECDIQGSGRGKFLVAVDTVSAGTGEIVLYATGSSARLTDITREKPVDAVVCGIIDTIEYQGKFTFRKDE